MDQIPLVKRLKYNDVSTEELIVYCYKHIYEFDRDRKEIIAIFTNKYYGIEHTTRPNMVKVMLMSGLFTYSDIKVMDSDIELTTVKPIPVYIGFIHNKVGKLLDNTIDNIIKFNDKTFFFKGNKCWQVDTYYNVENSDIVIRVCEERIQCDYVQALDCEFGEDLHLSDFKVPFIGNKSNSILRDKLHAASKLVSSCVSDYDELKNLTIVITRLRKHLHVLVTRNYPFKQIS